MAIEISGFIDEAAGALDDQLAFAKQLGMRYVCPRNMDGTSINRITFTEFESRIRPKLDEYGIRFSSIGSSLGKISIDDEEGYTKQLIQLEELIKIAESMECKYIRVFSFFVDPKGDYEAYFEKVVKKLQGFVDVAKGHDVVILHENEKKIFGDVPDRCERLFKTIDDPQFQLAYDASNYIQCGVDAFAAYQQLKDITIYYHIKDCALEGVEVPIGLGAARYPEILEDLIGRGYDGFLTLEPHTGKYAKLKNVFNILSPIAFLIKPIRYWHRVFRRIDRSMGIGYFQKVDTKTTFRWQYEGLEKLLAQVSKEAVK